MKFWKRYKVYLLLGVFLGLWGMSFFVGSGATDIHYSLKNMPPSWAHPFGTDFMGRDVLLRSIKGLGLSVQIGLMASFVSSLLALVLGIISALGPKRLDDMICLMIDICMGIPHVMLILMISVMLGGGEQGIIWGVVLTHWPRLTRLIRGEIQQIVNRPYVHIARQQGESAWYIAKVQMWTQVFPQYIVGLVLLFPHAIIHEAGISFLGYGLPLDTPSIGIMLSESIRYLAMGLWWSSFFPGLLLVCAVFLVQEMGQTLEKELNPWTYHT